MDWSILFSILSKLLDKIWINSSLLIKKLLILIILVVDKILDSSLKLLILVPTRMDAEIMPSCILLLPKILKNGCIKSFYHQNDQLLMMSPKKNSEISLFLQKSSKKLIKLSNLNLLKENLTSKLKHYKDSSSSSIMFFKIAIIEENITYT